MVQYKKRLYLSQMEVKTSSEDYSTDLSNDCKFLLTQTPLTWSGTPGESQSYGQVNLSPLSSHHGVCPNDTYYISPHGHM